MSELVKIIKEVERAGYPLISAELKGIAEKDTFEYGEDRGIQLAESEDPKGCTRAREIERTQQLRQNFFEITQSGQIAMSPTEWRLVFLGKGKNPEEYPLQVFVPEKTATYSTAFESKSMGYNVMGEIFTKYGWTVEDGRKPDQSPPRRTGGIRVKARR